MFYGFLKPFFYLLFKIFNRYQIMGKENIPDSGAVILVANHTSYWDPFVIGAAIDRKVYFIAKAQLFKIPIVGPVIRSWGAFPVQHGKNGDRTAIDHSMEILAEGKVLGIFIEGTRNIKNPDKMLNPRPGPAMLAVRSKAVVVPVAIINARKILWSFKRLSITFGKPLFFNDVPVIDKKELYLRIGNQITTEIMDLKKKKV